MFEALTPVKSLNSASALVQICTSQAKYSVIIKISQYSNLKCVTKNVSLKTKSN